MAHITLNEANAWLEPTKLTLSSLETELEAQVSNLVFARLTGTFDTSTWTNESSTPNLISTIIAMNYVAWIYDRTYSDDSETGNPYAVQLRLMADANIEALLSGQVALVEDPTANAGVSSPSFFPNDASSALEATDDEPSNGGPSFTMGSVF